ncbi:MAG: glycosyltransferase family 9 protein [Candidatus Omnitrophota bacterium]|nr:MAG: glycosyltransferase family 9 protein [Candidatus Omnitrophota bacterium]
MFGKKRIDCINPRDIQKILIIAHSNIGDISYDVTFLGPLRKHFPGATIFVLTSPRAKEFFDCYGGIGKVIIFDKHKRDRGFFGRIRFHNMLKREKFDLVITLKDTFEHTFLNVPYTWNVQRIFKRDFKGKKIHPVDIYMKFFRSQGIGTDEITFEYTLNEEIEFCEQFLQQNGIAPHDTIVGILPLAAWSFKNWPIEKWNQLATILKQECNIKTIAFGKSSADAYTKAVLESICPDIISAIDSTTLKQAIALITYCDVFIGPDSSLLHIASCLKVETVGLYGPTPADYVYPYFHRHNIIGPKEIRGMVCFRDQHSCKCREPFEPAACMKKITVQEVFETVKSKVKDRVK